VLLKGSTDRYLELLDDFSLQFFNIFGAVWWVRLELYLYDGTTESALSELLILVDNFALKQILEFCRYAPDDASILLDFLDLRLSSGYLLFYIL
jgi:hypothetical protein